MILLTTPAPTVRPPSRIAAALVNGDADTAARLLGQIDLYHQTACLDVAVDAALVHSPDTVQGLLALLPSEE